MAKKRILIIDDEKDFCRMVKLNLERTKNYEVLFATDGRSGIEIAGNRRPDLILLDIRMPGMSGGEIAEELLDDPSTSNIPIIFLTALVSKDEVAKQSGYISGRPFIAKPVTAQELIKRIEEELQ
ncbi:MAG: Transcriptional regulatory protein YycF [Syntrophorhabdus sp. PtaU1.Bin058]|nr:MAG: Transcriptional regulatory protein YycF [Syntrophorhabdus sp. PtaU1.Bin058]